MKFDLLAKFKRLPEALAYCSVKKMDYSATSLVKQLSNPDAWGVGSFISVLAPRLYLGDDGAAYIRWFDAELFEMRQIYKAPIVQFDHPNGGRMTKVPGALADATTFLNQAAYVIGHSTSAKGRAGLAAVPCSQEERQSLFGTIGALYASVFEADRFTPETVEPPQPSVVSPGKTKRDTRDAHHMKVTPNKPAAACVPLPEPCVARLPVCFEVAQSCCDASLQQAPGFSPAMNGRKVYLDDLRTQLRDMLRSFYRDAFEAVSDSGLDPGRRAFEEAGDVVAQAFEQAELDVAREAGIFYVE